MLERNTDLRDNEKGLWNRRNVWSLNHQSDLIHHSRYFLSVFS